MDNANMMIERTSEVEETTIRSNAGSQNFSDKYEKYLKRAAFVKNLKNYMTNDVNMQLSKSVRHGDGCKFARKTSACVLRRNTLKERKFEGCFKTKETKRVGRYA
jgi:hypothetical protein